MKTKNISKMDKYLDKGVLLVAVLVLGVVAYLYIVSDPFVYELGTSKAKVTPANVDSTISKEAERLKGKLTELAHEELNDLQPPDYATAFNSKLAISTTPTNKTMLANLQSAPMVFDPQVAIINVGGKSLYHDPIIPAPAKISVVSNMATLDSIQNNSQNAKVILTQLGQPPLDTQYISVGALFPAEQLLESLKRPTKGNVRKMPANWWAQRLAMADVQIQRQYQLDDGSWSDPHLVDPMPDRISFREFLKQKFLPSQAGPVFQQIMQQQQQITTPQFYYLMGEQWQPPKLETELAKDDPYQAIENDLAIKRLKLKRRPLTGRLKSLEKRIEYYNKRNSPVPQQMNTQYGKYTQDWNDLTRKIDQRTQELIREIEERLRQEQLQNPTAGGAVPFVQRRQQPRRGYNRGQGGMMPGEGMMPGGEMMPGGMMPGGEMMPGGMMPGGSDSINPGELASGTGGSIIQEKEIELWTTDFDIIPGRTYRYRMRAVITNPLYNRGEIMVPNQASKYNDKLVLDGPWSKWTDPIDTLQRRYFFLKTGREGSRSANIEVWKFTNANWFKGKFLIKAGDFIGSSSSKPELLFGSTDINLPSMDFSTGYSVVDLDFQYAIQQGIGSRKTVRLLYMNEDDIETQTLVAAQQSIQSTQKMIKEVMKIEVQEVDENWRPGMVRANQVRQGRQPRDRDRTRPGREGGMMPGEGMMPGGGGFTPY